MNDKCHPEAWVGCGFVATIENAPGEVLTDIEGIASVAAQIAWGMNRQKPEIMESYLEDLPRWGLEAIGWAWCDAEDEAGATSEGYFHAEVAASLPITKFIANMEEPYDSHGNSSHAKFQMANRYCEAFRTILPGIEFAVTTTPRWASDQNGMREAGAVLMPQAFFGDYPDATIDACCQHASDWGWDMAYVRPLVQVYENPEGLVPDPNVYLQESADWDVGVVPYILEQALGGAGRASLSALVPAITRPPHLHPPPEVPVAGNEIPPIDPDEMIGPDHGITALVDFLQRQPGMPVRGSNYNPEKPATWPWPERLERTLKILASDHDANI